VSLHAIVGQSKGGLELKVYVVRQDIGFDFESYYVVVGVYANETEAEKACLDTRFCCEEYNVIEKKETPC